jgi:hypothetical protein
VATSPLTSVFVQRRPFLGPDAALVSLIAADLHLLEWCFAERVAGDEPISRLTAALADRYRVERQLGAG